MDAEGRRVRAQIAALTRAATTDGAEISAPGRAAFMAGFETGHECKYCGPVKIPEGLPPEQLARAIRAARRAHFKRLRARQLAAEVQAEKLKQLQAELADELAECADDASAG